MSDKCVFCQKGKKEVPAMVTSEKGVTVCSLCLEDCLALFCKEEKGITRFIIGKVDSNGEVQIHFPRAKSTLQIGKFITKVSQAPLNFVEFLSSLPRRFSASWELFTLESEIAELKKQENSLIAMLAIVRAKGQVLVVRLDRLKTRMIAKK